MKFIALVSGGKDSFFNIHHCLTQGHELIALANLYPKHLEDEIDSFMFQTVGHDIISYYSECLQVPLFRQAIEGKSKNQDLEYSKTEDDEIEDLDKLIGTILKAHPDIQGVSCGAILSHYQRTRVENICDRFGLTSLAFLWQRDQDLLMQEMCQSRLDARIIKVAAIGLLEDHLGKSITEVYPQLVKLNQLYDVHICGEGGEFETIVLDCKFFKHKRLSIIDKLVVHHSSDVSYLKFKVELVDKESFEVYEPASTPALLEEQFEDLILEAKGSQLDIATDTGVSVYQPTPYISKIENNLYISNLSDQTADDLPGQTINIFSQLKRILQEHKLSFNDIQHITLLLSDMTKFSEINSIYQKHFQQYLPPSRVCIQTNIATSVQLSCKCIIKELNTKKGIHIRSRSYWAPPNIGPYSQARVEELLQWNYATISGQIPLVPASMDLVSEENTAMALSLQHFYRIKNLISITQITNMLCFFTDKININNFTGVWENYCTSIESSDVLNKIVLLKVSELPRNAIIEVSGDTYKDITDPYDDSDEEEETSSDIVSQVQQCFPDISITEYNSHKNLILLTNSAETMEQLFSILSNQPHHIKVYCSPTQVESIANYKFEYLPVSNVFNYKLQPFSYAINITL